MIKHIVMWKLKKEAGVSEHAVQAKKLKADIEALAGQITEIRHIEVGINIAESDQAGDVVLYSEFDNLHDLSVYQDHPAHQEVVKYVRKVTAERRVVDYET